MARHTGKCLDVEGTVTTEGALARQWTCNDSERQQFTLTVAEDPTPVAESDVPENIIKVYPDPDIDGKIIFDISLVEEPLEFTIVDVNGKVVYRDSLLESKIIKPDLNFISGIYLLNVTC